MIEITTEYLAKQGLSPNFPKRFWRKVNKTDSCWLWTASSPHGRYGRISRLGRSKPTKGRDIAAHVASWIMANGPVPKGLNVLHHCDNPKCVNPNHLWLGTHADNMRDMVNKCRSRSCRGEQHALHKLTVEQVMAIRSLHLEGFTGVELSKLFLVSTTQISNIVNNKQWSYSS